MGEEISLKDALGVLKRRFTIIIAIFLLFAIVGGALSFILNQEEYSSTTSLLVGQEKEVKIEPAEPVNPALRPGDDGYIEPEYETIIVYGTTVISQQAENLYNEIITSKDLLEDVIRDLDLDISASQLENNISMSIPPNSGTVEISVRGVTMTKADKIADKVAKKLMELTFEITEIENIRVMDYASKPKVSNTQNIKLNTAIASVLGIALGSFLALVMEYLDDRIRTVKNAEKKLKLDVIGEIPDSPQSAEILRTIRTNIQFSDKFKDKKTLVMTSPTGDQDNTKLVGELSNIIAEGNKKVLLIDADLRNPSLHEQFKIANKKGLSNILLGDLDLEESLNIYENNNNLHILTSGSVEERPGELLSGDKMKDLLSKVKGRYDYIILNAHSINGLADSIGLSALADGVILVLNAGKTRQGDAEDAKRALEMVQANIIGSLLKQG